MAYTVLVAVLTFKVVQGRWFSSDLKGRMRFSILVINNTLGPISYRLAAIHASHRDGRQTHRAIYAYSIAVARQKAKIKTICMLCAYGHHL